MAIVVAIDQLGELAVLDPFGLAGTISLFLPGGHAGFFFVHEKYHDGGGFWAEKRVLLLVIICDEVIHGGERGAVAVAVGANLHELGKDAIRSVGSDPRERHDGKRYQVTVTRHALGGLFGSVATIQHRIPGRIDLDGSDLLVVALVSA